MNQPSTTRLTDGIPQPASGAAESTVTVIVPVFNSSATLGQCLAALKESTYEQFDVLVVDDGSTEPIESLVVRFGYRYLRIEGPGGPARARNRGVENVAAEFVIFMDADVCVHADTIERFMHAFAQDPGLVAVVGTYDDAPADPGFLSQYRNLFHHYTHCRSAGAITTFWSGCGAVRRDVFLRYGGFDEQRYRRPAIEDIELGTWMAADGHRILLDPNIRCKHLKRWPFRNIVKTDVFQRGVPWIDLMLRSRKAVHNLNVSMSQRLSVVLVFAACVFGAVAIWWGWAIIGVAAALMAVTLLNSNFYAFLASRRGLWFATRSLPFHWLYLGCCGLSVVLGTVKYLRASHKLSRPGPLRTSQIR